MNDSILELAKKLKALAEQGVGGEKENAAEILERLCKKHNIDMSILDENPIRERKFVIDYNETARRFFLQVLASVIGSERANKETKVYKKRAAEKDKSKKSYFIELSELEYVEVLSKYEFYYRKFQDDYEIFYHAFLEVNGLTVRSGGQQELTDEERRNIEKVLRMMSGMDKHRIVRTLEYKN